MFIEEYLREVREERYAPAAWLRYLRRAAARVREQLVASPGAVRSAWLLALALFAAAFLAAVGLVLAGDRQLAYAFFLATSLTLLPVFALVTLHLDLLRDLDGYRLSALNAPIALTLLRVTLAPGLIVSLARQRYAFACATFALAAGSDVLDGWLARRWNQVTRLGTVLDLIVDIVFNVSLFAGLAAARLLPGWVLALAIARYGLLLVGGASLYVFVGPVRIQPTAFGRAAGVAMAALVALLLGLRLVPGRAAAPLVPLTESALGVLLALAVGQVIALGWFNLKLMREGARVPGRVVTDVRFGARR